MEKPQESAMQRIQVGIIGLVVVLLLVGVANIALDRAVDVANDTVKAEQGQSESVGIVEKKPAPEAPLSELGVAPVVGPDKSAEKEDVPEQIGPLPMANEKIK